MPAILLYVQAAMQLANILIPLGRDIAPLAQIIVDAVRGTGDPTADQWAALHAIEDTLRAELQAPLPPVVELAAASAGVTVGGAS